MSSMLSILLQLNLELAVAARYQLQKSFGRRISLAHSDSSKVKENGNAVQPEKETQMKTAVVGRKIPATAALLFAAICIFYLAAASS